MRACALLFLLAGCGEAATSEISQAVCANSHQPPQPMRAGADGAWLQRFPVAWVNGVAFQAELRFPSADQIEITGRMCATEARELLVAGDSSLTEENLRSALGANIALEDEQLRAAAGFCDAFASTCDFGPALIGLDQALTLQPGVTYDWRIASSFANWPQTNAPVWHAPDYSKLTSATLFWPRLFKPGEVEPYDARITRRAICPSIGMWHELYECNSDANERLRSADEMYESQIVSIELPQHVREALKRR